MTGHAARGLAAAGITCTAILLPAAILTSAGSAATAGSSASAMMPTRPVIVYVANHNSWTVTPMRAAASKAGKAIKVGHFPLAIAITPNGKTAYVADFGSGTVSPIRTATDTVGKAITVADGKGFNPDTIAITPNGQKAYAPARIQCGPCLRPEPSACRMSGWWRQDQPGPSTRAISARIRV